MINKINSIRNIKFWLCSVIIFSCSIFSSYSQEMSKMKMDTSVIKQPEMKDMENMEMLPMPFFTHMGIPYNVGTYGLRVAALSTKNEETTQTEFNFQFETGLSKTVGLFLGGEGLFNNATLEAMVQFLVWKSKNGMNGISPIIEFEFPLGKDATRKVYTLVGFATTFSNSHIAFNQVLHYSPIENLEEGSASLVFKLSKKIFLVSEFSGVTQKGESPIFNILGGVKVRLGKNILIGLGYQLPLTKNRDYSSRYIFQPNIMFQK